MAHKKIIDSVKKQGQVTIKDLDEFLRFVIYEYDMRTFDANYISILIPMQFDIDKVFGLNVCKRSDDDYVILYSCWYPNKDVFGRQFEMRLYHYDNSNDDDDLGLDIVMTHLCSSLTSTITRIFGILTKTAIPSCFSQKSRRVKMERSIRA